MLCRFAVVVSIAFLVLSPFPPAVALDANELRDAIVAGLDGRGGPLTGVPLSYEEVRVWPHDAGHRVEIAGLATQSAESGVSAVIGNLTFTVEEAGQGFYRVRDLSTSESISLHAADGSQAGLLTYRLRRFEGLWSSAIGNFLDMDLLTTGVRFAAADGSLLLSLDQLGAVSRSLQGENGLYNQEANARATAVHSEISGQGAFDVREITAESTVTGFDLDAYAALARELEALAAREGEPSEADIAALFSRMSALNLFPHELAQRIRLSDLAAVDSGGQALFHLDTFEWDVGADRMDEPLAGARLGAQLRKLGLGPAAGAHLGLWRELVPHDAEFVLAIERLPAQRLWQALLRTMALTAGQSGQQQGNPEAMGDMAAMMLLAEAVPALTEAGSSLRLPHFQIQSAAASLSAEGQFKVDPAAAQGMSGWINFALLGLDRIVELIQQEAVAGNPNAQSALAFAYMLKGLARRETDEQGRAVDRYDVVFTAEGQVLVNGQPFGVPGMPQ
jgi:hypothetical protein